MCRWTWSLVFTILGVTVAVEPSLQANQPPNIVFVEVDDLTFKYLGAFGAEHVRTPSIDALAARGVLFSKAIVQGCMCAPSRNSLITARYPQNLGLYSNGDVRQLPADTWAFPSALRNAGFHTAWIGKSHLLPWIDDQPGPGGEQKTEGMKQRMGFAEVWQSAGRHVALKRARELAQDATAEWRRGIDAYADHLHDRALLDQFVADAQRPTTLPVDDYLDGLVARKTTDWIAAYDRKEPFFLWVNFSGPHGPYNPPARYLSLYEPSRLPPAIVDDGRSAIPACLRPHAWNKREEVIPAQRAMYAGMITFIDEQIGRIVAAIERKGIADRTLVAFFSDHGIMEGDHGLMHKETLYKEVLNACLIVADPRGGRGKRVDRPVELLDLVPTVLELAGVDEAERRHAFGESLVPLLRDSGDQYRRTFAVAQIRDATALVTDRYKYIETPEGPVLFDLATDPDERMNVASDQPARCRELQARLDRWRAAHGPVLPPPDRRGRIAGEDG
jgi:arylsulfatase A-like enzyme